MLRKDIEGNWELQIHSYNHSHITNVLHKNIAILPLHELNCWCSIKVPYYFLSLTFMTSREHNRPWADSTKIYRYCLFHPKSTFTMHCGHYCYSFKCDQKANTKPPLQFSLIMNPRNLSTLTFSLSSWLFAFTFFYLKEAYYRFSLYYLSSKHPWQHALGSLLS